MTLQTDPTVIYGIKGNTKNIRRADLRDETNPYNTYVIAGLPPGPIASPGLGSLRSRARSDRGRGLRAWIDCLDCVLGFLAWIVG